MRLSTLLLLSIAVLVRPARADGKRHRGSIQYIEFRGNLTDPAVMEVKAYCASRGFLSHDYLTIDAMTALPPISQFVSHGRIKKVTIATFLRKYKNLAVAKQFWEDVDGSQIWLNYDPSPLNAVKLISRKVKVDFVSHYRENLYWSFQNDKLLENLVKINEWLAMRTEELRLRTQSHTVYLRAIDALFMRDTLSSGLFTDHIEAQIKKKLSVGDKIPFGMHKGKAISCAEGPVNTRSTRIIVAIKLLQ